MDNYSDQTISDLEESEPILSGQKKVESKRMHCFNGLPWKVVLIALSLAGITYFAVSFLGLGVPIKKQDPEINYADVYVNSTTTETSSGILQLSSDFDKEILNKLIFSGDEDNPLWFTGFELVLEPEKIFEIEVNNVKINGSSFTNLLKNFQNLKSLELTNVTIIGNFVDRIYLPFLTDFKLNIILQMNEELAEYKTKEKLKSLIFFDKNENQSWDLVDIASVGVNVEIIADGSKVIVVNEREKDVTLTMTYCDEILKNVPWTVKSLTLGNCSVSSLSIIKHSLTSIVLGNIGFTSEGNLSHVIKALPELREMYGSVPNLEIDLTDFSSTLELLCLSGIKLNVPQGSMASNIKELVLGGDLLAAQTIKDFSKVFPSVETLGIFGISKNANEFIDSLKFSAVRTVVVEYFPRLSYNKKADDYQGAKKADGFLRDIGIPKGAQNFLLTLPEGADRVGMALSEEQGHFFRYTLMGWFKIDSYKKYLRVIQEGQKNNDIGSKSNKFIGGVGGEVWPLVVPSG